MWFLDQFCINDTDLVIDHDHEKSRKKPCHQRHVLFTKLMSLVFKHLHHICSDVSFGGHIFVFD